MNAAPQAYATRVVQIRCPAGYQNGLPWPDSSPRPLRWWPMI